MGFWEIKASEMPKVQYHSANGGNRVAETDANGRTGEAVDIFSKQSEGSRQLVIDLAQRRGVNAGLFVERQPQEGGSKEAKQAVQAAKSAIARIPTTKDWKTARDLIRKVEKTDAPAEELHPLWRDYYKALIALEKNNPSLKTDEEFQREKISAMYRYP